MSKHFTVIFFSVAKKNIKQSKLNLGHILTPAFRFERKKWVPPFWDLKKKNLTLSTNLV